MTTRGREQAETTQRSCGDSSATEPPRLTLQILALSGLTILSVLLLASIWEFWLEDILQPYFTNNFTPETFAVRREYVLTASFFSLLALILPTWLATSIDSRRRNLLADLNRHRRQLQELVEHRTAALTEANAQLQREILIRREAERELKASEARYRELYETSRDGLAATDLQGRLLECNPALRELLGYDSPSELANAMPRFSPAGSMAADGTARASQIMQRGFSDEYELLLRTREGHPVTASVRTWLRLDEHQHPVGMWHLIRDISDQKGLEEQLRQAQKMEAVGHLAGGIAHDFNNLLTTILGYSEVALRRLPADHHLYQGLQAINKAGQRAANLTRQLLAFSRRQVLETRVINPNDSVTTIGPLLQRLLGPAIALRIEAGEAVGNIMADPGQLEQMLINLAANARDAMPTGGQFTIATGEEIIDASSATACLPPGRYAVLRITDTGRGIPDEISDRIFEPFFTTKEPGQGAGLGLATVHGIVRQHQGQIRVESEPDSGTTFTILLPVVDQPLSTDSPVPCFATGLPNGSGTVLVVDDEADIRRLVADVLTTLGYQTLEAANGVDALAMLENEEIRPDLLITGVMMPDMDGGELAERMQRIRPELKTIYMSGNTDEAPARPGSIPADAELLTKPLRPALLAEQVRLALAPGAAHRPLN